MEEMNKRPRPRRSVEAVNSQSAPQGDTSAPAPLGEQVHATPEVKPQVGAGHDSRPIPNTAAQEAAARARAEQGAEAAARARAAQGTGAAARAIGNQAAEAAVRARAEQGAEAAARARAAQGTGAAARAIGNQAAEAAAHARAEQGASIPSGAGAQNVNSDVKNGVAQGAHAVIQAAGAQNMAFETDDADSEKTRLTDVQPKSKLKTPVRKKKEEKKSSGTLRGILKALIYITIVIAVSCVLAYIIIIVANDVFAFVKSDEVIVVTIPENATVDDVAEVLGKNGIIEFPALFKLYASISGEDGVDDDGNSIFIPGEYQISPMNNYMQLLAAFQKQYSRDTVWVTFPEGTTVDEMITILVEDYGIASREEFVYAINEYDYGLDFLEGLDDLDGRYYRLEGYLFPDTYQFYTDSSAETIVYKMLTNFETKLNYVGAGKLDERLAELGMTLDEVVTLASIVEKEVKYPIDYDQVSSVFYNRLDNSSKYPMLESDATTIYAIEMETGLRPVSLEAYELAFESPYNTRVSNGLPPGAITNPGYEALYCAFYPAETNYYYFVADVTGYNLYAQTLSGHNSNKESVRRAAGN